MGIYRRAFHHIGYELDVLHEYVLTVDRGLKDAHEELHKRVRAKAFDLPSDEAQEIYNDHAEDDAHYGEVFPALSSYSGLVTTMSYLEHELVDICRTVRKATDGTKRFKPQGSVLESCRTLLESLNVTIPETRKEWQRVIALQKTRNVVVHELGELDEDKLADKSSRDSEVREFLTGRTDASIQDDFDGGQHKVVLSRDFCLFGVEAVREFLDLVVGAIPKELYSASCPNDRR